MATCAACGRTILVGGVKDGSARYCNRTCERNGRLLRAGVQVPDEVVEHEAQAIHAGPCPRCNGPGPVDLHESYQVWSAVFVTQWRTNQHVSCRRCGTRAKLADLAMSAVVGWWGIPWGLIMTPVQIVRNLVALANPPDPLRPSARLKRFVRLRLAAAALLQQRGGA